VPELWSELRTDQIFRIPAVRLAEGQAELGNDVYMYRFDYASPAMGGLLGACHALEIPFVFSSLDAPGAEMFVGPVTEDLRTLSRRMHDAWIAFARTGRPAADGLPEWPRYTTDRRATMLFDLEPSVVDDPAAEDREAWSGVL
jgi:para-nitrobenzyl esterase